MSTNLLIGLAISFVVVAGGGYMIYNNMQGESRSEVSIQTQTQKNEEKIDNTLHGTLASLLGLGQSLVCEFSFDDGTNVSNGTFYIAQGGERMRGDFNVVASAGGAMEGHMIRNDGYNYVWSSTMEQGVKMEIKPEDKNKMFNGEIASVPVDENTEYKCLPWAIDTSKFIAPEEIKFMDVGAQMDTMIQAQGDVDGDMGSVKSAQCGACAQIPDETAKAQCLAALSCS